MRAHADVVVVGGGTAGCVVAARLSEDPSRRVVLLEAGEDPRPIPDVIANPSRQAELVLASDFVETYEGLRRDGSSFPLIAGRVLGGGSSVNNMAVVRPMASDFASWERFGGRLWSYESLLPIMRAIECDLDYPDPPLHGSSGPLVLHRPYRLDDPDPALQALRAAAHRVGLPDCPDLNVPEPLGICASPYSVVGGRRQSTATAYLEPARDRPNLAIVPRVVVDRIVIDGGRARGVKGNSPDGRIEVSADEVVVSAGVYRSPQLLLLSGIGPPRELERLGIPVVVACDGVGENYQDHAVVHLTFEGREGPTAETVIPKVRLIARSAEREAPPDLHLFFRPAIEVGGLRLLPVSIHLLEQRSRGRLVLTSRRVEDPPRVETGMLSDPADVAAILGGAELVGQLISQPSLAAYYGPRLVPAATDDLAEHVATTYSSYHHGVGTCRMGPSSDPKAVVGPDLRVHGVEGLRVADASVLPTIPRANTMLAAILVGEVAARLIEAGPRSDPATQRLGER
jgi:choline dehydrogenase